MCSTIPTPLLGRAKRPDRPTGMALVRREPMGLAHQPPAPECNGEPWGEEFNADDVALAMAILALDSERQLALSAANAPARQTFEVALVARMTGAEPFRAQAAA